MTQTDVPARATTRFGGGSTPRVIIAGAGLGGIAQAVYLLQHGIETFEIFERAEGPGGVWWWNRYPGAAVDIPSLLYSYTFHNILWKRTHATQAEIQQYVEDVIDKFGFRDRITFGVGVERAVWDESRHGYDVTTSDGKVHEADVFVSAIGMFTEPNPITIGGTDEFEGELVHSARWPDGLDLAGKRVAVVGAGASAAQLVPTLAETAEHLISFQREPNWVSPKGDHDLDEEELARFSSLEERLKERAKLLEGVDAGLGVGAEPEGEVALARKATNVEYLQEVFKERPEFVDLLTPNYPLRCKRAVQSSAFLPALLRPNVEFVPRGVVSLTRDGIVDTDGVERKVDAVVLATGFQTTNFLATIEVVGRDGREIHDVWNEGDGPEAFLGMTVPGFPNFFMLYGPNTHGTVVSFVLEVQAEYIAKELERLVREGATAVEVRKDVFDDYQRQLQEGISKVVAWQGGCHNYYLTESGKNVVQWPWSHPDFQRWAEQERERASELSSLDAA